MDVAVGVMGWLKGVFSGVVSECNRIAGNGVGGVDITGRRGVCCKTQRVLYIAKMVIGSALRAFQFSVFG